MQYISSVYQNQRYGPIGIYFRSSQIRSRSFNSSSKSKPSGVLKREKGSFSRFFCKSKEIVGRVIMGFELYYGAEKSHFIHHQITRGWRNRATLVLLMYLLLLIVVDYCF